MIMKKILWGVIPVLVCIAATSCSREAETETVSPEKEIPEEPRKSSLGPREPFDHEIEKMYKSKGFNVSALSRETPENIAKALGLLMVLDNIEPADKKMADYFTRFNWYNPQNKQQGYLYSYIKPFQYTIVNRLNAIRLFKSDPDWYYVDTMYTKLTKMETLLYNSSDIQYSREMLLKAVEESRVYTGIIGGGMLVYAPKENEYPEIFVGRNSNTTFLYFQNDEGKLRSCFTYNDIHPDKKKPNDIRTMFKLDRSAFVQYDRNRKTVVYMEDGRLKKVHKYVDGKKMESITKNYGKGFTVVNHDKEDKKTIYNKSEKGLFSKSYTILNEDINTADIDDNLDQVYSFIPVITGMAYLQPDIPFKVIDAPLYNEPQYDKGGYSSSYCDNYFMYPSFPGSLDEIIIFRNDINFRGEWDSLEDSTKALCYRVDQADYKSDESIIRITRYYNKEKSMEMFFHYGSNRVLKSYQATNKSGRVISSGSVNIDDRGYCVLRDFHRKGLEHHVLLHVLEDEDGPYPVKTVRAYSFTPQGAVDLYPDILFREMYH